MQYRLQYSEYSKMYRVQYYDRDRHNAHGWRLMLTTTSREHAQQYYNDLCGISDTDDFKTIQEYPQ
jgi:hypothetical protein